ncbi:rhomboid family intramembrane serine protease [Bernardetia sp. Wsw4-3y2]|uniref:rhomboid family intramembrane serine protease n=1 Tax=Bernardetia sp. Wsw4-3y2 TaxID=3127471 RepID=UPI0030CFD8F6
MELRDRLQYEWSKSNNVVMRIIMINVAVYLLFATIVIISKFGGFPALQDFAIKALYLPADFMDVLYRPWTLITHAFTHSLGDTLHIIFNMLIFYWFGNIVVSEAGSNRLLGVYVWGIFAGATAFLMLYNLVPYFIAFKPHMAGAIGASAAVDAVVVAAATLLPNTKMRLLFFGEVSLKWIALAVVLMSFVSLAGGNAGGNMAHLGGALIGYLFVVQYRKGNDWSKPVVSFVTFFQNIFKRKPKMKAYRGGSAASDEAYNQQKQARAKKSTEEQNTIDEILDKISASGYESLTQKEKQILFQASKK